MLVSNVFVRIYAQGSVLASVLYVLVSQTTCKQSQYILLLLNYTNTTTNKKQTILFYVNMKQSYADGWKLSKGCNRIYK